MPESGNGNPLRHYPVWLQIGLLWGPITLMAIGLVYMGAKNVPEMKIELTLLRSEFQALTRAVVDLSSRVAEANAIARANCVAIADTEPERRECLTTR